MINKKDFIVSIILPCNRIYKFFIVLAHIKLFGIVYWNYANLLLFDKFSYLVIFIKVIVLG